MSDTSDSINKGPVSTEPVAASWKDCIYRQREELARIDRKSVV